MSQKISLLALSVAASAALEAERFITAAGAYPSAGGNTFGVTQTSAADGDLVATDVLGTAVVEAAGTIAKYASVQSDAAGKAVTKSTGVAAGIALEAAVTGSLIEVLLIPNAA